MNHITLFALLTLFGLISHSASAGEIVNQQGAPIDLGCVQVAPEKYYCSFGDKPYTKKSMDEKNYHFRDSIDERSIKTTNQTIVNQGNMGAE
ncbi:MAG: hypothetical protein HQM04_18650 [Magnetococcales bacterium]|nr:hypothetical protein [Magnetococcales bacterium]